MYSQWHTTALCSPTRSTILTGRNHHLNGCACITERAHGFPGWQCRLPARVLHYRSDSPGRWLQHLLAGQEPQRPRAGHLPPGASRKSGRLQKGFNRFYGFIGGETNQWYPDLSEDNRFIDQPYSPEKLSPLQGSRRQGHRHDPRSEGQQPLQAVVHVVLPGANHAPHHSPKEYADRYKGKFDDGYEAYREWVLPRMIDKGILPPSTQLTPFNPLPVDVANPAYMVRP